jgi:hypothetical protein
MKRTIIALLIALATPAMADPAHAAAYNITLECGHRVQRLQECVGSRNVCLTAGSHEFDRLSPDQSRVCEVNVAHVRRL